MKTEDTVQSAMTDRPHVLRTSRGGTGSLLCVCLRRPRRLLLWRFAVRSDGLANTTARATDRFLLSLPHEKMVAHSRRRRMEWRVSCRVGRGRARSATHRQGPPCHCLILCLELEVQVATAATTAASCLFSPARSGIGTGLAFWPTLRNRCTILVATAGGAGRTHFLLLTWF